MNKIPKPITAMQAAKRVYRIMRLRKKGRVRSFLIAVYAYYIHPETHEEWQDRQW